MSGIKLHTIRECLEGAIPGNMATCAADGTPNVTYLSQVEYVDDEHVACSYQFFNKTRQNILENPSARLLLIHPVTAAMYRLTLRYLRTETEGPLFERMKAKLAGIASHSGMSGIFRLLGSDVYEVLEIEELPGGRLPVAAPRRKALTSLRRSSERLTACADLEGLLDTTIALLKENFDIQHAMVMMLDAVAGKLYTVASGGYVESGVGSEVAVGQGIIGVAAREGSVIRIGHMASEYLYSRAIRSAAEAGGMASLLEKEIPLPGLADSRSQMAVPIKACERLMGVLYVESEQDLQFGYDDEDALVTLAGQLGIAMHAFQAAELEIAEPAFPERGVEAGEPGGAPVVVRYYAEDGSVFLGRDYLIKGVAGNILWALVRDYTDKRQTEFSNRELRLDPRIGLPDVSDNLEARLVLLERRLAARNACMRLEKTGRGRFRLVVRNPLELSEVADAAAAR